MESNERRSNRKDTIVDENSRSLFYIGKYNVMVRDIVWILISVCVFAIVILGMLVRNSQNSANAISVASTLLSIALSFIAIIKSMFDSADSSRINATTEKSLAEVNKQIDDLMKKIEDSKQMEVKLEKDIALILPMLEILSDSNKSTDEKEKEIEKLSREGVQEDIEQIKDFIEQYFN